MRVISMAKGRIHTVRYKSLVTGHKMLSVIVSDIAWQCERSSEITISDITWLIFDDLLPKPSRDNAVIKLLPVRVFTCERDLVRLSDIIVTFHLSLVPYLNNNSFKIEFLSNRKPKRLLLPPPLREDLHYFATSLCRRSRRNNIGAYWACKLNNPKLAMHCW